MKVVRTLKLREGEKEQPPGAKPTDLISLLALLDKPTVPTKFSAASMSANFMTVVPSGPLSNFTISKSVPSGTNFLMISLMSASVKPSLVNTTSMHVDGFIVI